eukprot:361944-Chlamydomonas_euryale.AAC.8
MHGWMDGWVGVGARIDRQTGRQSDGQTDGWMQQLEERVCKEGGGDLKRVALVLCYPFLGQTHVHGGRERWDWGGAAAAAQLQGSFSPAAGSAAPCHPTAAHEELGAALRKLGWRRRCACGVGVGEGVNG